MTSLLRLPFAGSLQGKTAHLCDTAIHVWALFCVSLLALRALPADLLQMQSLYLGRR